MTLAVPHRPPFAHAADPRGGVRDERRDDRPDVGAARPREPLAVLGAGASADASLVARIADGDAGAHALLYERHSASLLLYLRRLVTDAATAEELLHDVFLDVWGGASTFRGDSRVGTWLLAVAHSRACNELRRRALRSPAALAARLFAGGRGAGTPHDPRSNTDARLDIAAALDTLPASQAAVVDLVYWHGLALEEVARVVGVPIGTVKSRLTRARRALRSALEEPVRSERPSGDAAPAALQEADDVQS